jgi:hypothetical protein
MIILALVVAFLLWVLFVISPFILKARRERAQWRICLGCQTFHNAAGGFSWTAPFGNGWYRVEECTDCKRAAVRLSKQLARVVCALVFGCVSAPAGEIRIGQAGSRVVIPSDASDSLNVRSAVVDAPRMYGAVTKAGPVQDQQSRYSNPKSVQIRSHVQNTLPLATVASGEKSDWNQHSNRKGQANFIDRLAFVESRHNCAAIGDAGERGSWQLTEAAWADVNRIRRAQFLPEFPFIFAHDDGAAREYALQYLGLQSVKLSARLNRQPTESELLALWQLGFRGFQRCGFSLNHIPTSTRRAIERLQQ